VDVHNLFTFADRDQRFDNVAGGCLLRNAV